MRQYFGQRSETAGKKTFFADFSAGCPQIFGLVNLWLGIRPLISENIMPVFGAINLTKYYG